MGHGRGGRAYAHPRHRLFPGRSQERCRSARTPAAPGRSPGPAHGARVAAASLGGRPEAQGRQHQVDARPLEPCRNRARCCRLRGDDECSRGGAAQAFRRALARPPRPAALRRREQDRSARACGPQVRDADDRPRRPGGGSRSDHAAAPFGREPAAGHDLAAAFPGRCGIIRDRARHRPAGGVRPRRCPACSGRLDRTPIRPDALRATFDRGDRQRHPARRGRRSTRHPSVDRPHPPEDDPDQDPLPPPGRPRAACTVAACDQARLIRSHSTGRPANPRGPKIATNAMLARSAAAMTVNMTIAPWALSSGSSASGTRAEVTRFTAQALALADARSAVENSSAA